ncbi:unnamed protein product [Owenia fusiformis]|uniref:TGF-beta family profile domain-containing protein n=1 Tax=Owenia fusiformis TaxID=6347 RepID=A0A8S4Q9W8_OWEFU|nr:unnamed protein product [Owenia fusiformis]
MKVPVGSVFVIVCLIGCCCIMGTTEGKARGLKETTPEQKSFLQRLWDAIWGRDHVYDDVKKKAYDDGLATESESQNRADGELDHDYQGTIWDIDTYADENLTAVEELELHMLKLLGVKEIPKPKPRSKIPIYMDIMYMKERKSRLEAENPLEGVNVYAHTALKDSNVERGILHFNLSDDIDPDTILSAELALYRYYSNRCPETIRKMYAKIPKIDICTTSEKCITIKTPNMREKWFDTFDLSDIIKQFAVNGVRDLSIRVRIEGIPEEDFDRPAYVYPNYAPKCIYRMSPEHTEGQQPLLMIYHEDPNFVERQKSKPRTDEHRKREKRSNKDKTLADMNPEWKNSLISFADECKMHSWKFDFSTLKWNWWIYPKYSAVNFCKGWCHRYPPTRTTHHISSDHAHLVNMYHTQPDIVAQLPQGPEHATCVPETYTPMAVVYITEENNYRQVHLSKLVVESCGCR